MFSYTTISPTFTVRVAVFDINVVRLAFSVVVQQKMYSWLCCSSLIFVWAVILLVLNLELDFSRSPAYDDGSGPLPSKTQQLCAP